MILLHPRDCYPPHKISHEEHLFQIRKSLSEEGWKKGSPVLIGYPWDGYIQLISGSHRWQASKDLNLFIPVEVYLRSDIESIWGSDRWIQLINNAPYFEG